MTTLNMKAIVTFVSPAILAVLLFAGASAVNAAGFDCKKAQSKIEQMICSDPKLSALDEELSAVYKEASGLVSDPSGMKKAQLDWIRQKRGASDNAGDLEAAYLARIEEIRLDPRVKKKLFARSVPPAFIFGRYSETEPDCAYPKEGEDEYDCSDEPVESYIDIKAGPGNAVAVTGELFFLNGFVCGPFGGTAEWVNGSLRLPNLEDEESRCVLILRFSDGKVFTEDPGSVCKTAFLCGANAGFHNIELPKLTDRGSASDKEKKHPRKSSGSSKIKKIK